MKIQVIRRVEFRYYREESVSLPFSGGHPPFRLKTPFLCLQTHQCYICLVTLYSQIPFLTHPSFRFKDCYLGPMEEPSYFKVGLTSNLYSLPCTLMSLEVSGISCGHPSLRE